MHQTTLWIQKSKLIGIVLISLSLSPRAKAESCIDLFSNSKISVRDKDIHSLLLSAAHFQNAAELGKDLFKNFAETKNKKTEKIFERVIGPTIFVYAQIYATHQSELIKNLPSLDAQGKINSAPATPATEKSMSVLRAQQLMMAAHHDPKVSGLLQKLNALTKQRLKIKGDDARSNAQREQIDRAESAAYDEHAQALEQARLAQMGKAFRQALKDFENNMAPVLSQYEIEMLRPELSITTAAAVPSIVGTLADPVPYLYNSILKLQYNSLNSNYPSFNRYPNPRFEKTLRLMFADPTLFLMTIADSNFLFYKMSRAGTQLGQKVLGPGGVVQYKNEDRSSDMNELYQFAQLFSTITSGDFSQQYLSNPHIFSKNDDFSSIATLIMNDIRDKVAPEMKGSF